MSEAKGLLTLRVPHILERTEHERVAGLLDPIAQALGVKALILGPGAQAELQYDHIAQLDRICVLLEQLVEQGKPTEKIRGTPGPEIPTPAALNGRPDPFRYDSDKHHG